MLSIVASSTIFWVFGITRPGIEPRSPRPLANTLHESKERQPEKSDFFGYRNNDISIYIYMCVCVCVCVCVREREREIKSIETKVVFTTTVMNNEWNAILILLANMHKHTRTHTLTHTYMRKRKTNLLCYTNSVITLHIYVYILNNLLNNSTYGKGKKPPQVIRR